MAEEKRFSRQRQAILDNLKQRYDHPSADMVYEAVKLLIPNISMGTVYRNLNELAEDGTILKLSVNGKDRFDGNPKLHIHFCCKNCGKIFDFDKDKISMIDDNIIGTIFNVSIDGICNECL